MLQGAYDQTCGNHIWNCRNTLPLSAVERIEVLKDGASALYGSDAIAGVVNVILKRDYTGTEATVRFGQADVAGLIRDRRATMAAGEREGGQSDREEVACRHGYLDA